MPRISKETQEIKSKRPTSKTTTKEQSKSNNLKTKQTKKVDSSSKTKNVKDDSKVTNKTASKKVASKTTNTKVASNKTTNKKSTSKKSTTKKVTKKGSSKKQVVDVLEYYDLPYRYNKTVVKILAQTPKTLFVYWDISDEDRSLYIKQYGKNFFEETRPVLIIHNTTMNYTFEIEINDFANCWYFNVNDEKCEYLVELGRRPKRDNLIPENYLYITSSNKIESPNGHILFEKDMKALYFKNIKTNESYSKDIVNLNYIKYIGKIYNIYDMYKKIYKEEEILDINNPTSSFK